MTDMTEISQINESQQEVNCCQQGKAPSKERETCESENDRPEFLFEREYSKPRSKDTKPSRGIGIRARQVILWGRSYRVVSEVSLDC